MCVQAAWQRPPRQAGVASTALVAGHQPPRQGHSVLPPLHPNTDRMPCPWLGWAETASRPTFILAFYFGAQSCRIRGAEGLCGSRLPWPQGQRCVEDRLACWAPPAATLVTGKASSFRPNHSSSLACHAGHAGQTSPLGPVQNTLLVLRTLYLGCCHRQPSLSLTAQPE